MKIDEKQNTTKVNIRGKFIRGEEVKFISHLDVMRTFERVVKRTGLPISYSKGFNPQARIVFGLPLAVGFTTESDYADFQFDRYIEPQKFVESMNKQLPLGFKILSAEVIDSKENIMSIIRVAAYSILVYDSLKLGIGVIKGKINLFLQKEDVMIGKRSKKGIKNTDIKPLIYKLEIKTEQNTQENQNHFYGITALIGAGGTGNLRPELLIDALNFHTGMNFQIKKIHRTGLYVEKKGNARGLLKI